METYHSPPNILKLSINKTFMLHMGGVSWTQYVLFRSCPLRTKMLKKMILIQIFCERLRLIASFILKVYQRLVITANWRGFSSVFKTWFDGLKHWVYYGIDQVFVQVEAFTGIFRTKYSRMDQLKFVEGSL